MNRQRLELHVAGNTGDRPAAAEDRDEQLLDGVGPIGDLFAHERALLGKCQGQLGPLELDRATLTQQGADGWRGPLHHLAPAPTNGIQRRPPVLLSSMDRSRRLGLAGLRGGWFRALRGCCGDGLLPRRRGRSATGLLGRGRCGRLRCGNRLRRDDRRGQLDRQQLEDEARPSLASADARRLGDRAQDLRQPAGAGRIPGRRQQPATRFFLGLVRDLGHVPTGIRQVVDERQGSGCVPRQVGIQQACDRLVLGEAQCLSNSLDRDGLAGIRQHLVEQRLGVAHPAIGQAGQQGQRLGIGIGTLAGADAGQLAGDRIGLQAAEVEPLRPADHGGGHLVGVSGGQDEDHVLRRLLNELEQRVEGVRAEHVDLVDDVDPLSQLRWGGQRPHHKVACILDQAVAGGVDLDDVHGPALANRDAGGAGVAWLTVVTPVGAVDGLGQDARGRCLAGAAGAYEEIGVGNAVGHDGVAERGDDVVLTENLAEALRPPATVERLVGCAARGRLVG